VTVYVGTSGWQYRHWRRLFYDDRPHDETDLTYFACSFATVEVNATFYRLPEASTFKHWVQETPDDFVFAIKANRYLTHIRRLRDPDDAVALMMERARCLGARLGPVLLQLPPTLQRDDDLLARALDAFPAGVRVAVEFRHNSWFDERVACILRERDVALCLADRRSRLTTPAWRTASWAYVRFHEGRAAPAPCYGRDALGARAGLLASMWPRTADLYVYFNNDTRGCAVRDAATFARMMRRRGYNVTRTPPRARIDRA
jgi:uncharacterized protein YecE (DUF72 family)